MKSCLLNVFSLLFILGISNSVHAKSCGNFVAVKGSVQVKEASKSKWKAAKLGGKVCEGSQLKTGKEASAKIRMLDKNVLSLSAESEFQFEKYEYSKKSKKVSLNLLYGILRSAVNEKYDDDKDYFRVKTKTAVAGVRGTDFVTEFDPKQGQAVVTAFAGALDIRNFDGNGRLGRPVQLRPGFSVVAKRAVAMQAPKKVSAEQLRRLDRRSRIDEPGKPPNKGMEPKGMRPKEAGRAGGLKGGESQRPQERQGMRPEGARKRFERIGNFNNGPMTDNRRRQIRDQRDQARDGDQRRRQVPPPGERIPPGDRLGSPPPPPPGTNLPPPPPPGSPPPPPPPN